MDKRTVELLLTAENLTTIAQAIGTWDKLWEAVGYLSTWNMEVPIVRIHRDGDTDLVATYLKGDGELYYVIGAVWHGTHYGFHS
jgi:hypothetical protein